MITQELRAAQCCISSRAPVVLSVLRMLSKETRLLRSTRSIAYPQSRHQRFALTLWINFFKKGIACVVCDHQRLGHHPATGNWQQNPGLLREAFRNKKSRLLF